MIPVKYANLCSVCHKDVTWEELEKGYCKLKKLHQCSSFLDKIYKEFEEFFKKIIGEPRSIQKFWARRVLSFESFAAVAPTGIGKTSFGSAMALFLALKKRKSYIILPTTLLVEQVVENLRNYCEKAGIDCGLNEEKDITVAYYHGKLKEKDRFFEILEKNAFDILVTTTQFLPRYFEKLSGKTFNFIFVDDVDAVLKASRNVDRILKLLGFRYKNGKWEGKPKGVLMVSTATAKKGQKVRLFRELLNFDVGTSTHAVRNIEDVYVERADVEIVKEILRKMGTGGLIYARSSEEAEELYNSLKDEFKVGLVTAQRKKDFVLFERGEIDYLIGTAYYYGTLVRGLDLPERIRFAVFFKAPVFRVRIEDIDTISPGMVRVIALIFKEDERIKKFIPYLPKITEGTKEFEELKGVLKEVIAERKKEVKDFVLREGEVVFPDVRTYIQGSGRTSRLFAGGITKGASFLLEDDEDVLKAFIERARYFDVEFKRIEEVDFESLIREINESRERFRKRAEFRDVIKPTLFIVESPTKARQISRFFGQPSVKVIGDENDVHIIAYEVPTPERILIVTASLGHVTDLITNRAFHGVEVDGLFVPIYASIKRCRDCGYQFTEERENCPKCESSNIDDSKKRIEALRRLAKETGEVIIGTDPDSEGEKIAWDIKNLLSGCAIIKRAEFHEVTRRAVTEALANLRDVDENLVKAQIVRRVEDRWIGFILSQKLWEVFKNRNLSAGRAQTPVLGWIIQRAEENRKKKTVAFVKELGLSLEGIAKKELELEIELIEKKEEERVPLPPYTTDSMLRDANAILKMSAKDAMQIAQELFEHGLITYHRTDSTRVSEVGLRIAKEYLGEDFTPREWFAEGAHECIRPTRAVDRDTLQRLISEGIIVVENFTWRHFALYDLIFRRFMASQCKPYKVTVAKYKIKADGKEFEEERIVKAEGKAYELYKSVWVRNELPTGKLKVEAEIRRIPAAPLYTQSDVVALMKERRIGRPSTYATIVDKLFQRNYIIERGGKLVPTKLGYSVYEYLINNYRSFVSEERTRLLEEMMDKVEKGEADYFETLKEMYREIRQI